MQQVTKFLGIDISKDVFDVCTSEGKHFQFANTTEGFRAYSRLLDSASQTVMEATGSYHQKLASWLFAHGHVTAVVNPLVIKRFAQMRLRIAKTDKADAKIIQAYAFKEKPSPWSPPARFVSQAFEINSLVELLIRQRTALKNKLHSVDSQGQSYPQTARSIEKLIKLMDGQITDLEEAMENLIKENQGPMFDQLRSIPGIGRKTAMFLIVVTNGFEGFDNSKQLSSLSGFSTHATNFG